MTHDVLEQAWQSMSQAVFQALLDTPFGGGRRGAHGVTSNLLSNSMFSMIKWQWLI